MKKTGIRLSVLLILVLFACGCASTPKGEPSDKKEKADTTEKKDKKDKEEKADKADKTDKKDKVEKAGKSDTAPKEKNRADDYYRDGLEDYKKGEFKEAIEEFKKAIEKDSKHLLAYYGLGLTYESLKRTKEAEESYEEAIRIDPKHLPSREALGLAYFKMDKYKNAEPHLKAARTLDSKVPEVYFALGEIEQKEKACRTAIIAYKQALKLNPNYLEAHNALKIAEADCRKKKEKPTIIIPTKPAQQQPKTIQPK
jgi:tetratricopeptide (TPR) repeat protein